MSRDPQREDPGWVGMKAARVEESKPSPSSLLANVIDDRGSL